MKIGALRLFNVRRFAGRGVAIEGIGDGVNVLCAVNEFGKSTSFEALHALFFQHFASTSADVRALRPYSGGNPMIEADIATEQGRFRITKQFYGGRSVRVADLDSGRLIAQADEAEALIAGLIRGGTAGPAGLLWVRQGVTGIERRSRSEDDGEKQVRTSLLESVQGEVEAVTGGRRMAEIMAACSEELGRLVTPTGRPKSGERLAAAIDERDRLAAAEQRLAAEVAALREAIDQRAKAARRLAELERPEDRAERRNAILSAEAAFDAAKAQGERLRAAEVELKLVRERRDISGREVAAFGTAAARAEALRGRSADAERLRAEADGRRQGTASALAAARAALDGVEAEETEARALLARLDAAMRAREAAERLAEQEKQLADAEAARRAMEEGEAALAPLRLSEKSVAELERLEVEVAALRAVREAGRPSVAIAYAGDAVATVTMDGRLLQESEQRSYAGQAELVVPGVAVITLQSSQAAGDDGRLEQTLEKRRALLASMGVADLPAARGRQMEAQRRDAELREVRGRLSLLAPAGLAKLREEVAARRAMAGEVMELKADPDQVRAALAGAESRRLAARQTQLEAETARAGADDAFVAAGTTLAEIAAERAQVEAVLGPEEERAGRERALVEGLAELDRRLEAAAAQAERLRRSAVDPESAQAALTRVRSAAEAADKEAGLLREQIAGLGAEIRTRSDDAVEEKWRECADARDAAGVRVAALEREVAVLQRLSSALETARSQARDLYLKPIMTELRPLLGMLFDDVSITFDEKTLLPQTISRNGQEEKVESLSGGMREQLSVLTRLAFARLLARDGRPAPVILDDALVYSDDDRIEKMFDALHRQARDQQIIVFSCRQRAFQQLGGTVLHMADWRPEP